MTRLFPCPYLNTDVELTDEREAHIREKHEATLDRELSFLAGALTDPDEVRRSKTDARARLFCRWYDDLQDGKYLIVVVVDDRDVEVRNWILTAYATDQPRRGTLEWKRS